jgi:hypothetical protein
MSPESINGLWGLGGAVIGAVLGVLGRHMMERRSRERRSLDVIIRRPVIVVDVAEGLGDKVRLLVGNTPVERVYSSDWEVLNTGNKAIENIEIQIESEAKSCLQAFEVSRPSGCKFDAIWQDAGSVVLKCDLLNAGERIVARAVLDSDSNEFTAVFRRADVQFRSSVQGIGLDGPGPFTDGLLRALGPMINAFYPFYVIMGHGAEARRFRDAYLRRRKQWSGSRDVTNTER